MFAYRVGEHGVAGSERHFVGESVGQLDVELGHAGRFFGQSSRVDHPVKGNERRQRHHHLLLVAFNTDRVHKTICCCVRGKK